MNPQRIVITGGPGCGKTTLAEALLKELPGCERVWHTDDLIGEFPAKDTWSASSLRASGWMDEDAPWIIEGVAMTRALRKWHVRNPGEAPPVDRVIRLVRPHIQRSQAQEIMARGEATVWQEVVEWLGEYGLSGVQPDGTVYWNLAPAAHCLDCGERFNGSHMCSYDSGVGDTPPEPTPPGPSTAHQVRARHDG